MVISKDKNFSVNEVPIHNMKVWREVGV